MAFNKQISFEYLKRSYLEYYSNYYGNLFTQLFELKLKILPSIAIFIKENKNLSERVTLKNIKDHIEYISKKMKLDYYPNQLIINDGPYSMYIQEIGSKIYLKLNEPTDYNDLHKIWHEFGHVIHYQNMNSCLPFSFIKLYNLTVMESIAILFQIICNKFYEINPYANLFNLTWWSFVQFFSHYEWLNNDLKVDYDLIHESNMRIIFKDSIPYIPVPIRYLPRSFKSFRYSCATIIAIGINRILEKNFGIDWIFKEKAGEQLKIFLQKGGNAEVDDYFKEGLNFFVK